MSVQPFSRKYALYGLLFGLCFPVIATLLRLWGQPLNPELSSVWDLHLHDSLFWIIDTAPFVLAWLATLIGRGQDRLLLINQNLNREVACQTEDLRHQNEQLESEVQERKKIAEELIRAKIGAESAAQAKADFLSTMSHEIRTPMNAVIGMTGLLQDTTLGEEQREFVDTIRISGNNLLGVINDILDFSKIEAGKMEIEWSEMDLLEPVEDTLDLLSSKATEKGLELLVSVEKEVPRFIIADLTKIRQVLLNLVGNAIKFTAEGEILVSVTYQGKVAGKEKIQVSVKDTGIGIPSEKLNRLFESFSQVDASTTRKFGGTGLGLAICKRMVEMLGGEIWVESEEGQGSAFLFTLIAEKAERTWELPDVSQLAGKKILLVDDNATNLTILEYQCREWGLAYQSFQQPRDVITSMEAGACWDLGILDMEMPEMNGVQIAQFIRNSYSETDFPLVLLSSIGLDLPPEEKALFNTTLFKPARKSLLPRRILNLYSQSQPIEEPATRSPTQLIQDQLPPIKTLLVEDNPINQKVAVRMLGKLGMNADVVGNGKEAVEALQVIPYQLVFMDMQMPIMDGVTATEVIRELLPEAQQPIIIAMTANAFQEDRQRCLDAGMQDYLAKPIRLDDLASMILQWFGPQLAPGEKVTNEFSD